MYFGCMTVIWDRERSCESTVCHLFVGCLGYFLTVLTIKMVFLTLSVCNNMCCSRPKCRDHVHQGNAGLELSP